MAVTDASGVPPVRASMRSPTKGLWTASRRKADDADDSAAIFAPSLPAMGRAYTGTPGLEAPVRLTLTITSLATAVSPAASGLFADPRLLLATRALLGVAVGAFDTDLVVGDRSRAASLPSTRCTDLRHQSSQRL